MEHASYLVDILDKEGSISHTKARRDVDKAKDIYHGIYVFLITPEKDVLLGVIPARDDLPNLYPSSYGTAVATIRRHQETAEQAAARALSRELFIDDATPVQIGEFFEEISNRQVYASVFYFESAVPDTFSNIDISRLVAMTPQELDLLVEANSNDLAPTLRHFWQKYRFELPL